MGALDNGIEESQHERVARLVAERFTCHCGDTTLRKIVCSNGTLQYKRQCNRCGTVGSPLAHSSLRPEQKAAATQVNLRLQEAWYQAQRTYRQELLDAEREAEQDDFWQRYNAYLRSPEWQRLRRACLERDGYQCRARMLGCEGRARQAHHLSYDHVFNEPLFELVAVCDGCHEQITEMDRERRRS